MASSVIVPIVEVKNVREHPNASMLGLAEVLGFQVVVGLVEDENGSIVRHFKLGVVDENGKRVPVDDSFTGEIEIVKYKFRYINGDRAVYFPADTIIPNDLAERLGVKELLHGTNKDRVKRCALRGEPSFGMLCEVPAECLSFETGYNLADYFGCKKYEPPLNTEAGDAAKYVTEIDSFIQKYTDIENGRIIEDVFSEDDDVVITEKIHGCLKNTTKILMGDGSKKIITKVKKGDTVLGVDENGRVVETKVLNTFNNGPAESWLTVKGKRKSCGQGNSYFSVICTPNHKFMTTSGYVEAGNLNVKDKVFLIRSDIDLSPVQKQVILGKLLGDGSLHRTKYTSSLRFAQKTEHLDYINWTIKALNPLAKITRELISGYGTKMTEVMTSFIPYIKKEFDSFYVEDKKIVPKWVEKELSPISMAFWYMDDGSLSTHCDQEDRVCFATNSFTFEDCEVLQRGLLKFGIDSVIYHSNGYRIRLNENDAEKFFLLIAPYVPSVMQYKLPKRYRGGKAWILDIDQQYKPFLVEQEISEIFEIEKEKVKSARIDIETETHNFFANNILVHNSNDKVGFVRGGGYFAGSMQIRRKCPIDLEEGRDISSVDTSSFISNVYWSPFALDGVKNLIDHLKKNHQLIILYGEVFGGNISSLNYGINSKGRSQFRAFDILVDGKYLDWENFKSLCEQFNVPMVPVLYVGKFSESMIKELREGNSVIDGANHMKEGIVVKAVKEVVHHKVGRKVLKYISTAYDLSKHKQKDTTDY